MHLRCTRLQASWTHRVAAWAGYRRYIFVHLATVQLLVHRSVVAQEFIHNPLVKEAASKDDLLGGHSLVRRRAR